ncbi:hypothetical protein PCL_09334 [Purpureocillium lilacinum]|uniref:Uncharacterized protein n=1 Tax=Purpureocillium lilacinum TaxID=33203 RepID=A0A2U3EHS3_PURLI|nr:hypothetical protein Purlil1_731 [Purpureocillium lilacinum]PWI74058.1 hypothetical protein PCL_09334 [Purpureocillium lilacinum]
MLLVFYVTIWLDARRLAGVQVLMGRLPPGFSSLQHHHRPRVNTSGPGLRLSDTTSPSTPRVRARPPSLPDLAYFPTTKQHPTSQHSTSQHSTADETKHTTTTSIALGTASH